LAQVTPPPTKKTFDNLVLLAHQAIEGLVHRQLGRPTGGRWRRAGSGRLDGATTAWELLPFVYFDPHPESRVRPPKRTRTLRSRKFQLDYATHTPDVSSAAPGSRCSSLLGQPALWLSSWAPHGSGNPGVLRMTAWTDVAQANVIGADKSDSSW